MVGLFSVVTKILDYFRGSCASLCSSSTGISFSEIHSRISVSGKQFTQEHFKAIRGYRNLLQEWSQLRFVRRKPFTHERGQRLGFLVHAACQEGLDARLGLAGWSS